MFANNYIYIYNTCLTLYEQLPTNIKSTIKTE